MQYSTHFNMNKPELSEQYRLSHWNENTDIIDNALYALQNLTDTTFKTNLFNFMFPKGTVYQNADDSRSPETLFGFGTWVQITDAYLACRGGTHIGASGGAWSYTLTSANIPQHNHGMQHYHYTNISHGHGITQTEHNHAIWGESFDGPCDVPYHKGNSGIVKLHEWTCGGAMANITVNDLPYNDAWRFSAGSVSDTNSTPRINTDNWGTANPTAISLIPTYVGVYTWKRTV